MNRIEVQLKNGQTLKFDDEKDGRLLSGDHTTHSFTQAQNGDVIVGKERVSDGAPGFETIRIPASEVARVTVVHKEKPFGAPDRGWDVGEEVFVQTPTGLAKEEERWGTAFQRSRNSVAYIPNVVCIAIGLVFGIIPGIAFFVTWLTSTARDRDGNLIGVVGCGLIGFFFVGGLVNAIKGK